MTPKPLFYSAHARRQLRARHITRQQVRWLLAQGIRRPLGDGMYGARGYFGRQEAELIVTENATRILVITVMWID